MSSMVNKVFSAGVLARPDRLIRFLDSATGERVGIAGWLGARDTYLESASGDADTTIVAGGHWTGLAGEGALQVGYVIGYPR